MIIWFRAKPGHAALHQTEDGQIKLWWRGVFGVQIGNWFVGAINGSREMTNDSKGETP